MQPEDPAPPHLVDALIMRLVRDHEAIAVPDDVAAIVERIATAPFSRRLLRVPARDRGLTYDGITVERLMAATHARRLLGTSRYDLDRAYVQHDRDGQSAGGDQMAQVAWKYEPERFIAHDLERLLAFWRTAQAQAEEWPEWDDESRENFRIEWTIDRERLIRVKDAAAAGLLDERQQRDWQELQQLIETHRATVEWMLDGPI